MLRPGPTAVAYRGCSEPVTFVAAPRPSPVIDTKRECLKVRAKKLKIKSTYKQVVAVLVHHAVGCLHFHLLSGVTLLVH